MANPHAHPIFAKLLDSAGGAAQVTETRGASFVEYVIIGSGKSALIAIRDLKNKYAPEGYGTRVISARETKPGTLRVIVHRALSCD